MIDVEDKMSEFEKTIVLYPAFDKRDPNPSKNYGVHGVDLRFYLKKDNKAVQFVLYTNWQLPHVTREQVHRLHSSKDIEIFWQPMPADVGYHSPYPMYDDQPASDNCHLIEGDCYYDGSGLAANDMFEVLLHKGSDGVWCELEKYWHDRFGED